MAYENSYIWTAEERMNDWVNDHRSYIRNLSSCEKKAWKKFRLVTLHKCFIHHDLESHISLVCVAMTMILPFSRDQHLWIYRVSLVNNNNNNGLYLSVKCI